MEDVEDKQTKKFTLNGKTVRLVKSPDQEHDNASCNSCVFDPSVPVGLTACPYNEEENHLECTSGLEVQHFTYAEPSSKGIKYDEGKIQWWYLPIEPIKEVLKVLHYGDKKYPADDGCNWKQVSSAKKRYYSALMRHVTAWWDGEKNDQESGLHHLAHACTNVLFLLWFEMKGYPEIKEK